MSRPVSFLVAAACGLSLVACGGGGESDGFPFLDTFDRADSASPGSSWIDVPGSAFFRISGNRLQTFGGFSTAFYNRSTERQDLTAQVEVRIAGGLAPAFQVHLLARSQSNADIQNAYSCVVISGVLQLFEIVGGAPTALVSGVQAVPNNDGTAFTLAFRLQGQSLTCSISGSANETLSITDASFGPSGFFGLASAQSGDHVFMDNFRVDVN
jgi:hypothetical protein